jgi:hypothetical protein
MLNPSTCRLDGRHGIVVLAPAAASNHQKEIGWRDARQRPCRVVVPESTIRRATVPRHEGGYRQAKCFDRGRLGASEDYLDDGAPSDDQLSYAERHGQSYLRDAQSTPSLDGHSATPRRVALAPDAGPGRGPIAHFQSSADCLADFHR